VADGSTDALVEAGLGTTAGWLVGVGVALTVGVTASLPPLVTPAVWLSLIGTGEPADPLVPPPVNAASAISATIEPTITAKAPRTSTVMAGAASLRFGTAVSFRSRTPF
jgi:hypothetical protein